MTRIAVGQISCESNTFASFRCDLETVRATGYLHEGTDLFALRGTDSEVSGALDILDADPSADVVPLIATRWNSSSVLQAEAHAYLRGAMLERLRAAGPVDGVFLSCHGSMVATDSDDPEGDLAAAVRAIVGPEVPIAMTLDLHANVTDAMVDQLDLIVGYEHYPHDDSRTTGQRATRLLLRAARGEVRPTMARVRLPIDPDRLPRVHDRRGPLRPTRAPGSEPRAGTRRAVRLDLPRRLVHRRPRDGLQHARHHR